LPSNIFLPGFDPIYGVGDALLFDTPIPSEVNLNLIVIGGETQWSDINCGTVSANYADGDTLGCVALGVAWLIYSVYLLDGGPGASTPARSLSSSKHHFQVHSNWEPVENCTTRCMLLDHAPKQAWTPVGNGTYNGIYHELYFMRTDKFISHMAVRAAVEPDDKHSVLNTRQYASWGTNLVPISGNGRNPRARLYETIPALRTAALAPTINEYPSPNPPDDASDWMGESVEEAVAMSNNSGFCFTLMSGGVVVSSALLGIDTNGGYTVNGQNWGSDWNSAADVEDAIAQCQADNADGNHVGSPVLVCGHNLSLVDPSFEDDPDGLSDPTGLKARSLYKRTGASAPYDVRNMAEVAAGTTPVTTVIWESAPYINGANGQTLQEANEDDNVYSYANLWDCTDASISNNAPITGPNARRVDAEHIFERNTVPTVLEVFQTLVMDIFDGNGPQPPPAALGLRPIPFWIIANLLNADYELWPNAPEDAPYGNLGSDLADCIGLVGNPFVMANLDHALNLGKTRIWRSLKVTGDDVWNTLTQNPTTANTEIALDFIRMVSSLLRLLLQRPIARD
jgi:hypothetical protein